MPRPVKPALLGALAVLLAFLLWFAFVQRVEMFDAYEILINAKFFATGPSVPYFKARAYFTPLLYSLLYLVFRLFGVESPQTVFVTAHVFAILVFAAAVWAAYRLFRLHLDRGAALIGATLLAFNSLLVHQAPMSKEDIPGMLWASLAFFFYLRARQTSRVKHVWLGSLFFFITLATRYNLIPLMPIVVAAYELVAPVSKVTARLVARKALSYCVAPVLAWLAIASVVYARVEDVPLLDAPAGFIRELMLFSEKAVGTEMGYAEYPWENLFFLGRSMSLSVAALALLGMWVAWRRRVVGAGFHGIWLAVFLVFHSFVLGHKEARYLFPLLPPLYFFAAAGASELGRRLSPLRKSAQLAVFLAVAAFPVCGTLRETVKFAGDPFYTTNFGREVSEAALEISRGRRLLWAGPYYAIHPSEYVFDLDDEVTYLYHVFNHTVYFWTGVFPKFAGQRKDRLQIHDLAEGVFFGPAVTSGLRDGDTLLVNVEENAYVTRSVPVHVRPLTIERARLFDFSPDTSTRGGSSFSSEQMRDARVELTAAAGELRIVGHGVRDGVYAIVLSMRQRQRGTVGLAKVSGGKFDFRFPLKDLPAGFSTVGLSLQTFDVVRRFAVASQ